MLNKLCDYWYDEKSLLANIIIGLNKAFQERPRCGWVRHDEHFNEALLSENSNLKKENDKLKDQVAKYKKMLLPRIINITNLDELFELNFSYYEYNKYSTHAHNDKIYISWNKIFLHIAPKLISPISIESFNCLINGTLISRIKNSKTEGVIVDKNDMRTIKFKFITKGLLMTWTTNTVNKKVDEFINLTTKGLNYLQELKNNIQK